MDQTDIDLARLEEKFTSFETHVSERLDRILEQTTATNGRVTRLERNQIADEAKSDVSKVIWKAAAAIVASLGTLVVIVFAIADHL